MPIRYPFPFRKSSFGRLPRHRFEDGEFPIPEDAEAVLRAQYQDWRQMPPPEKRPNHARIIDPFHAAGLAEGTGMRYPGRG